MVATLLRLDEVRQLATQVLRVGLLRQGELRCVHRSVIRQHHVHRRVRHAEGDSRGDEGNNKLHGCGVEIQNVLQSVQAGEITISLDAFRHTGQKQNT